MNPVPIKLDKEILNDFVQEVQAITLQLNSIVLEIQKSKMANPNLFEEYGQTIDRIYGTAMTLGLSEIGLYARSLKETTYMCSQSQSERGKLKTYNMMMEAIENMDQICRAVHSQEELRKVRYKMHVENAKAERLQKAEFHGIKRKSCAA